MAEKLAGNKEQEEAFLKDKNIMIISGNEDVRGLLTDILKSAGAKVDKEESAKRALEVLVSLKKACQSADLIIAADIDTEDIEFLRKIKNTPHCEGIPIIIINGTTTKENIAEAAEILPFPFEIDVLFNAMAKTFKT